MKSLSESVKFIFRNILWKNDHLTITCLKLIRALHKKPRQSKNSSKSIKDKHIGIYYVYMQHKIVASEVDTCSFKKLDGAVLVFTVLWPKLQMNTKTLNVFQSLKTIAPKSFRKKDSSRVNIKTLHHLNQNQWLSNQSL